MQVMNALEAGIIRGATLSAPGRAARSVPPASSRNEEEEPNRASQSAPTLPLYCVRCELRRPAKAKADDECHIGISGFRGP